MTIILVWLIFAVISAVVASGKGRSSAGWFLLGLFFGPLAILAIAIASRDANSQTRHKIATRELRECPFCHEGVQWRARVCHHCKHELQSAPTPTMMEILFNKRPSW